MDGAASEPAPSQEPAEPAPPGAAAVGVELSEYEQQRDVNIHRNQLRLASLGLAGPPSLAQSARPSGRAPNSKRKSTPGLPSRQSTRLGGLKKRDYSEEEGRRPPLSTTRRGARSPTATARQSSPPPTASVLEAGVARDAVAWDAAAAAAAAQELRAAGSAGAMLWLHPSLAFADVYVLASEGSKISAGLALDGQGVRVEVGGGPYARVLELPVPLRPVCDDPQGLAFFDCSGGVWRLRWMLEARRRRSCMVICSPPLRPWRQRLA